jgi:ADP-ribose pyrophosphatase
MVGLMNDWLETPGSEPPTEPGRIGTRLIHDGRVVHLSMDQVRFPDGTVGELEFIRHRGASAVVPFLGDPMDPDPEVVLIHQYRYAAGGFVYEIPAGIPLDGEGWEECARRELEEETGYLAGSLQPLTRFLTTPGFTNEEIHLFLATELEKGEVRRDKDEFLEVVVFPFSRVLSLVREGVIRDGKSLVGILLVHGVLRNRP